MLQYRKRYELLQLETNKKGEFITKGLQYRKRYELLQQYSTTKFRQYLLLQYRKRYELLQHTKRMEQV